MPILSKIHYIKNEQKFFMKLMCGTCFFFFVCISLLWFIPFVILNYLHEFFLYVSIFLSVALLTLIVFFCTAFLIHSKTGKVFCGLKKIRKFIVKFLFPCMEWLGQLFGISREKILQSFIMVNNEMVLKSGLLVNISDILLLIPHCIQNSECRHRLTFKVENCVRCAKCDIANILYLKDKFQFSLYVVNGGTSARRIVVDSNPKLIIAIACNRDLSSGIQDTYPLPVFGILNERPYGPCFNTRCNCSKIQDAIDFFTKNT